MDQSDWQIVRSTPLFGAMPQEVAQSLVGNQAVRVYEKGTLLFQQGETARSFFVVLDGWVKLFRTTPDGSEAVVGVFRRGESFAEAAIFIGGRYPVSAEVATTARLVRIDGELLRRRIREQPDLAFSMLASASHHLKFLVEQIEQIKSLSAPQRIADFLIKLCPGARRLLRHRASLREGAHRGAPRDEARKPVACAGQAEAARRHRRARARFDR